MSDTFRKIMAEAVRIRTVNGEELESVLASYPKLTDEDKEYIRSAVDKTSR